MAHKNEFLSFEMEWKWKCHKFDLWDEKFHLPLLWEKECSWQEFLPSSSSINVQRHVQLPILGSKFSSLKKFQLTNFQPTSLRDSVALLPWGSSGRTVWMRVRQLLHLARRRTCWLSSERGPLFPLAVACGALVKRLVQPDISLFWNFFVGVFTFLVSPAGGAQQELPEEAGTRPRCCPIYTSAPCWWWIYTF